MDYGTVNLSKATSTVEPMEFAAGTSTYPGSYRGLEGVLIAPWKRKWAPFGVQYVNGSYAQGFYCHHYREENEHYHVSHDDMKRCKA